MKKTLLFTLGLLAASTTAWADAVDFLSPSGFKGFKAYKIQARRGPNAAGTAYADDSGKGFMLTNEESESDLTLTGIKVQSSSIRLMTKPILITTSC